MPLNIPDSDATRVVIIGAGFGGFRLAQKLASQKMQIVLIDKNNYHQFQPLLYQVAMAGLEPSSISFPLRKSFQSKANLFVRVAEVNSVDLENKKIETEQGNIYFDKLVIATGAKTNFFNNAEFEENTIPMKSVSESLYLRNKIFEDLESAITSNSAAEISKFMDIVIVGGGPTGVELAGALAEMKMHILHKDYPDLNSKNMNIYLIEGKDRLLAGMSEQSSEKTKVALEKLGVKLLLNARVQNIQSGRVILSDGQILKTGKVIWAAGVTGAIVHGISQEYISRDGRLLTDDYCRIKGHSDVFAIGDVARMETTEYPNGHPQMAPAAMQQASWLGKYLMGKTQKPFKFTDKGQMATIGRNKAVAEFAGLKLSGFMAWLIWLMVHIYYLIGVKNKLFVLLNWIWSYLFYDQNLRLIIRPKFQGNTIK
ncbi:MAG: NAD(P)/FAD-dependent oxidoreductase [Saprospiraceae bacterium]|nr:NAD(P)/FAD-dependent oxidoreductase [Saprospiraceae bacterium]MBK7809755.1 NAD(P)/FAD-dependent oxidoreductase [Saprospiraceae bacterium]MBK9632134.1 NAD(P)/FAD-dependent oxidoreductase [Saprospiraceae bacterium]